MIAIHQQQSCTIIAKPQHRFRQIDSSASTGRVGNATRKNRGLYWEVLYPLFTSDRRGKGQTLFVNSLIDMVKCPHTITLTIKKSGVEMEDSVIENLKTICLCKNIKKGTILKAIHRGCHTVEAINRKLRTGSGDCNGEKCHPKIKAMIEEFLKKG